MPRFEYPGGILPEEMATIQRFEAEVFPYTQQHGPEIGEAAMQGDLDATEIIKLQRMFCEGLPHLRALNLAKLIEAMKRWDAKRTQ